MHGSHLDQIIRISFAFYVLALVGCASGQNHPVRLDSSDWWSYTRQEEFPVQEPQIPIRFQNREPAEANFQVAGITLGEKWNFADARSTFGKAQEVERGDAASGRNQICYTSPTGKRYLIFELGEVNAAVYLFEAGPKWNGSKLCKSSEEVSANTSTASGLKLGLAPQQVKAILGSPSSAPPGKLIYHFEYKKKTPAETMQRLRKEHPEMGDTEFSENFGYAYGEAYIEARFASGRMNYLAISKSETY